MESQETKRRFVALRAGGLSYTKIAAELGVSKQTLITWSREFHHEISNLKVIEWETLIEKYGVARRNRLELFAKRYQAVMEELSKRDLIAIPTEKLFDLAIKLNTTIQEEDSPPIFSEFISDFDSLPQENTWKP